MSGCSWLAPGDYPSSPFLYIRPVSKAFNMKW